MEKERESRTVTAGSTKEFQSTHDIRIGVISVGAPRVQVARTYQRVSRIILTNNAGDDFVPILICVILVFSAGTS